MTATPIAAERPPHAVGRSTAWGPSVPAGRRPGAARYTVVYLDGADGLAPHLDAWADLADSALEPNAFYEPWMLLPAVRHLARGVALRFLLVFGPDPARPCGPPPLCGFFPLERRRGYQGLPVTVWRLWKHEHCFLCAPLVRAGHARGCLAAAFTWLAADPRGSGLLELGCVPGEGPFHQALIDHLHGRAGLSYVSESYTRAVFRPRADADAYLAAALSGRSRKRIRRQKERLAALGRVEWAALEPGQDPAGWIDQFLALEAGGWKGRRGTAMALRPAERAFFRQAAAAAHARGRLLMLALRLDGRPIAMQCNFRAGDGAFAFKVAFDEAFAGLSPGVLLETENIRRLHADRAVRWMDCCSTVEDVTNKRLWPDRRVIQSVLVATGRPGGNLVVSLLPLLRWLWRTLRRRGRSAVPGAERPEVDR